MQLQKKKSSMRKKRMVIRRLDVMKKGKNAVKINPSLGESIRAELDLLKAQRIAEQDASMKQQDDEKKKEQLADKQAKKDKMMRMRILRNKMLATRAGTEVNASHQPEGDTIAEGEGHDAILSKAVIKMRREKSVSMVENTGMRILNLQRKKIQDQCLLKSILQRTS